MKKFIFGLMVFLGSISSANAWVYSENVQIAQITQWQDSAPIYFLLSNKTTCYIPATEKNMYALILDLHVTGKKANVHCHDSEDDFGGVLGHRLHRIIAVQ